MSDGSFDGSRAFKYVKVCKSSRSNANFRTIRRTSVIVGSSVDNNKGIRDGRAKLWRTLVPLVVTAVYLMRSLTRE